MSMRQASFAIAAAVALSTYPLGAQAPRRGIEFEAISLLGDTLRRPRLDSATRERMQEQLAAARVEAAAKSNDSDPLIWVGRRLGYLRLYTASIAVFTDGIRRFPDDARMYRHRGHRYIRVREVDNAIRDFNRAAQLMAGKPDEVEPDGQPNARGIPIGSLQSNVWYHLALAHYLKGDWNSAARAARSGIQVSNNPDRLVSQTHWLYMALRRAGRTAEAAAALAPIRDDFDVIENESYYRLVKAYRNGVPRTIVDSILATGAKNPSDASFAYGVANWVLYNGDTTRAIRAFEQLMSGGSWASFGYLAAEADVARLRRRR